MNFKTRIEADLPIISFQFKLLFFSIFFVCCWACVFSTFILRWTHYAAERLTLIFRGSYYYWLRTTIAIWHCKYIPGKNNVFCKMDLCSDAIYAKYYEGLIFLKREKKGKAYYLFNNSLFFLPFYPVQIYFYKK